MEIPFVGGAYQGRSPNINAQVCQNLYPVMDQQGGKVMALMGTPGLSWWASPVDIYYRYGVLSMSGTVAGVKT